VFQELEQGLQRGGADAVFDALADSARAEKNYSALFNVRLMQKRWHLGLPLLQTGAQPDVPAELRPEYERALMDAARETGRLYLAEGEIEQASTYFEAIGETGPVSEAIDKLTDSDTVPERVIQLAFYKGINQRKGFELILKHNGVCSALTAFSAYQDSGTRDYALAQLVARLYEELACSLRRVIASVEGTASESAGVGELIRDREWLFEGMNQYVDSTHVAGLLPHCRDLADNIALHQALEMAEYGSCLNSMYQFRGDPPFEEVYRDHAIYLRAMLGEAVEPAVTHFRNKIETSELPAAAAELLICFLLRLERYSEALQICFQHLDGAAGMHYPSPSGVQLCQLAGDYERLCEIGVAEQSPALYAAGLLLKQRAHD